MTKVILNKEDILNILAWGGQLRARNKQIEKIHDMIKDDWIWESDILKRTLKNLNRTPCGFTEYKIDDVIRAIEDELDNRKVNKQNGVR